ncbi:MAG: YceI family protein [Hyphomicrobiaceae bacterium]
MGGLALPSRAARADTFAFAGGHTSVHFTWSHAGLSRHWGRIIGATGSLEFDPLNVGLSKLDVRLKAEDISTGVAALDRLLRSPDFFNVAQYPNITFRATAVQATGERKGDVTGDLTIAGITKPVTLHVTWNFSGAHPLGLVNPSFTGKYMAAFSATAQLRRSDWGLGRGAPLISDEIELRIETEMVRTKISEPLAPVDAPQPLPIDPSSPQPVPQK